MTDHNVNYLAVETDCETYLALRLFALERELAAVERLAAANELPDATITNSGRRKISPLDGTVPEGAEALIQPAYGLLPHVKITELLLEASRRARK